MDKISVILALLTLAASIIPASAQSPVTYQYAYDSAGRLTEAVDSNGDALVYAYDAAGNLLSITKQTGVHTAIFGVTDANGNAIHAAAPGQTITLTGIGLGDCPLVTVTVDGITATIVSKTTNTITITIPQGATNGVIVVNTCHGSATFTLTIGGVTVSPATAILTPGQTFQFVAAVLPSTLSQAVTWSVDGIDGGDDTVGTITASGLYTAPAATGSVTVQATSVADPELSGGAQVSIVDPSDVGMVLSPGVSVLLGRLGGPPAPTLDYALSPGVSVMFGPGAGGNGGGPDYVLSPGVSVLFGPGAGGNGTEPIFVLSPGVSVVLGGASGPAADVFSPGVSVVVLPSLSGTYSRPIYVLSPGVSVQNGPTVTDIMRGTVPVYVVSPGVSVQILQPTTGGGGGTDDNETLTIISPGVSVAPAAETGRALTPHSGSPLRVARLSPTRLTRGGTGVITVTGTHLDEAKAVGFVDDLGRLDPDITIQSAKVQDGGQAMTLHLSVRPGTVPGRRRLVLWTMPRPEEPHPGPLLPKGEGARGPDR